MSPYAYSPYYPYMEFYDQYASEADESRRAAEEIEASAKTDPLRAKTGSSADDSRPLLPRAVTVTLDGQTLAPSAGGGPIVIGSGQHTLRVSQKMLEQQN